MNLYCLVNHQTMNKHKTQVHKRFTSVIIHHHYDLCIFFSLFLSRINA